MPNPPSSKDKTSSTKPKASKPSAPTPPNAPVPPQRVASSVVTATGAGASKEKNSTVAEGPKVTPGLLLLPKNAPSAKDAPNAKRVPKASSIPDTKRAPGAKETSKDKSAPSVQSSAGPAAKTVVASRASKPSYTVEFHSKPSMESRYTRNLTKDRLELLPKAKGKLDFESSGVWRYPDSETGFEGDLATKPASAITGSSGKAPSASSAYDYTKGRDLVEIRPKRM